MSFKDEIVETKKRQANELEDLKTKPGSCAWTDEDTARVHRRMEQIRKRGHKCEGLCHCPQDAEENGESND